MDNQPTIIKIETDRGYLEMDLPWDANGDDWADAFRSILFWKTFSESTIDSIVPCKYREWEYTDE